MNLLTFAYFSALARQRSFTKAAQQLHMTQQSLSSHIAALERELGCQLVLRRVPLELTYAGSVFLRYAETIQQELKNLRQEFCDITENQTGILRIGIAFTRSRAIMPKLILEFQQQYPNIQLELSEAANQALQHHLINGEIDLAIANFTSPMPNMELIDFYQEHIVLLASRELLERVLPSWESQAVEQIRRGDLSPLRACPFLLGSFDDIAGRIGRTMIEQAGFSPIIKAKSDNIETLLALCEQGAGVCFCPENLAKAAISPEVLAKMEVFRLGEHASYPIQFGCLKSNYQWSILLEFIRIARQVMSQL